jgi:hypothetical protein
MEERDESIASEPRLTPELLVEAMIVKLSEVERRVAVLEGKGAAPVTADAEVRLHHLPSGRWSSSGLGAIGAGATRGEALASLGRLLDEYPTLPEPPPEAIEWAQRIAAERGYGSA